VLSSVNSLVSTSEVAARLDTPSRDRRTVLLDVRWRLTGPPGRADYDRDHLPGAVFVDLDADLAAPPGKAGRHPLPEPAALQATLRAVGINGDDAVVAYDHGDGSIAARAWWLLRWAGHGDAAVLDGGYAAWTAESRPVTAEVPEPQPGDIKVQPGNMPVLDADQAAALATSETGVLLDARAPERYRGDVEPIDPKAGHVPGARNAPFSAHVDQTGRWRPPAELAERFAEVGVRPGTPVGAYCGSGVTAASVVLALEVSGVAAATAPAALYVGSWSNWSADPTRPVATGPNPTGNETANPSTD
jgi:thiosulfate/3-mercaptopyruvate sulfurtransferase